MIKNLILTFISVIFIFYFSIAQSDSKMVLIPGDEFMMGKDDGGDSYYGPAHLVKLDSFYIDKYEVTNAQYMKFCLETGHKFPEFWNTDIFKSGENYPDHPVVGVSWWDAKKYADWAGKRLPTEAEWEIAARGGLLGKSFPNGDDWTKKRAKQDSLGWKNLVEKVGLYEPNGYGLYDMGGNVWEWVFDSYSAVYYKTSEKDNPKGPRKGNLRAIRGGSWHSGTMCKTVFNRRALGSYWCDFGVGFRCVKDIQNK